MRVLVACEFSGVVRDAFRRRGHDAWSNDLIEHAPEGEFPAYHLFGDCRHWIKAFGPWDLMIAHPPCTYLCNSGVRWLYKGPDGKRDLARWKQLSRAREFFWELQDAPIPRIAVENPIPHRHALFDKPDQIVQPWQFGHGETKATCLWLKGLPKLEPTDIVAGRHARVHLASPGPERWKERSRTYRGIAEAMAQQWGE